MPARRPCGRRRPATSRPAWPGRLRAPPRPGRTASGPAPRHRRRPWPHGSPRAGPPPPRSARTQARWRPACPRSPPRRSAPPAGRAIPRPTADARRRHRPPRRHRPRRRPRRAASGRERACRGTSGSGTSTSRHDPRGPRRPGRATFRCPGTRPTAPRRRRPPAARTRRPRASRPPSRTPDPAPGRAPARARRVGWWCSTRRRFCRRGPTVPFRPQGPAHAFEPAFEGLGTPTATSKPCRTSKAAVIDKRRQTNKDYRGRLLTLSEETVT